MEPLIKGSLNINFVCVVAVSLFLRLTLTRKNPPKKTVFEGVFESPTTARVGSDLQRSCRITTLRREYSWSFGIVATTHRE